MGIYIKESDVQIRLIGKVRFTEDLKDENKMSLQLLRRLVSEAEGEVELDLSPRYSAPFVTDAGQPFAHLPARPTQETLRTLCELKAVCRVLETDFGSGTIVDASKYKEPQETRYKQIKDKLLEIRPNSRNAFRYPPLPGLQLNYMNTEADDGYAGEIHVTSEHPQGGYPATRISSPGDNYWNGTLDDGDLRPGGGR